MAHLPSLSEEPTKNLEKAIDEIQQLLPEMKNFILPGGSTLSSYCHIARCVCRRAERLTIESSETTDINPIIISYLNRLSDYLFTLSRKVLFDAEISEQPWIPNKKENK
jgi:cob(I)alamin adenosyltransferase